MKKILSLLMFLLGSITCLAQTNATAVYSMIDDAPLGHHCEGVAWANFSLPTLPGDAVITGIYPVVVVDWSGSPFVSYSSYGTTVTVDNCAAGGSTSISQTPSGGEFYSGTIGTSYSALSGMVLYTGAYTTLSYSGEANLGHAQAVGFAVYYTSANPSVNPQIPPPFAVPIGSGVAWSIPTSFTETGNQFYGYGLGTLGRSNPVGYISLGGIVEYPNKDLFNGTMTISMQKNGVQNICNYPRSNVPRSNVMYKVVNGVPLGLSSGNYASQDCLSPRIPYYVSLIDNTQKVVSTDNWYVPNTASGLVDIGDMQEQKFNGPITVAIPQGIISTPLGNQTITQPAGTALDIYGTVNFHSAVGFSVSPSFTTINANQLLVNGVVSSSFAIDANGIINASTGFCVAACATASDGMALIYDHTVGAFVPKSQTVVFPTLYNQQIVVGGVSYPQRSTLEFGSAFAGTDTGSTMKVDLGSIATPGTYTGIASITLQADGRISSISTSTGGNYLASGTITIPSQTLGHSAQTLLSFAIGTSVPADVGFVVDLQGDLGLDFNYNSWIQGNTIYVRLLNSSYVSTRTSNAVTMSYRVLP